jgi:uncharacterized protein (TIGR02466 family)
MADAPALPTACRDIEPGLNGLFPTLIWRADAFSDSAVSGIDIGINAALAQAIRDARQRDRDFSAGNYPNGYTTYASNYPLRDDPRCAALQCWILQETEAYLRQARVQPGWHPVLSSFFGTLGRRWSQHAAHRHENSEISGVYHVEAAEGSAGLILHSPLEPLMMASRHDLFKATSRWTESERVLSPRAGQLILFPSWLEHAVAVQQVDGERLAISVNIVLKKSTSEELP